jgi:hypothetical protein
MQCSSDTSLDDLHWGSSYGFFPLIDTGTVFLRAERSGKGDGRVYRVHFTVRDTRGATCRGIVTVGVPHDQGKGRCGLTLHHLSTIHLRP